MNEPFKLGDRVISLDDPLKQGVVRNTLERYAKGGGYTLEDVKVWKDMLPGRFLGWRDTRCDLVVRWDGEGEPQYVKSEDLLPLLEESVRL